MKNRLFVNLVAVAALAVLVAFASGASSAAPRATLLGTVTDPSGAAVPNAIVDLLLKDGDKPLLSTTTTSEGLFSMTGVRTGTYKIAVTATSFAVYHADRVVIDASRETTLPAIKLGLASTATSVQVVMWVAASRQVPEQWQTA